MLNDDVKDFLKTFRILTYGNSKWQVWQDFIPVTSWVLGWLTRFSEGKIVAGIIRLIFGWNIIWILDIIFMILQKHILRLLNI